MLFAALFLAAQLAAPAVPAPVWVELGPENRSGGLTVPSDGDGVNKPDTVAGSACRRPAGDRSLYLYVQADDQRVPPGKYDAYLAVEYFDGFPGIVNVQYEKVAETPDINTRYARAEDVILMLGTGKWQRGVLHLPEARFGNGQNFGSELRLCTPDLAIRRIEVAFAKPADYKPGGVDPAAFEKFRTQIGPGVELTFGNDASPSQALLFRALGVTSIESYVTWQTVEDAGKDQWDWSHWDRQVEILKQSGLKWVPFLIAGPAYANPKWFRESDQSLHYVCLEHGTESKVQSLWNPHLRPWIERFLQAFAERYRDQDVIESVLLGITGIYGESIYPAGPEGGWTAGIPGPYHNHMGWWAGDRYAAADFRAYLGKRYKDVNALNRAWKTAYPSLADVSPFLPEKAPSPRARADMVRWYVDTMTDWSTWWVAATRKHFPKTEIYLCTGGDGSPVLGADFSAQAKAIAAYGAGIRITNEASNYAANFAVTREVATACRALGTFYGFEPAGQVDADGVTARIYNATASGALQLHYYSPNVTASAGAVNNYRRYAHFLQRRTPYLYAGVYLPKTSWALDTGTVRAGYQTARVLRDYVDLEFVDKTTLGLPGLRGMRVLVLPGAAPQPPQRWGVWGAASYAEAEETAALSRWVSEGGILITAVDPERPPLRTPEGGDGGSDAFLARPPRDLKLFRVALAGKAPRRFRLDLGKGNDGDYLFGDWYHQERGLEWPKIPDARKRWSGPRPGIYLPIDPSARATLTLEAHVAGHSLPGPNRVLVNGIPVGALDKAGSSTYRFAVPQSALAGRSVAEVTFDMRTWKPSDHGTTDARDLGVALHYAEICSAGAESSRPPNPPTLGGLGGEKPAAMAALRTEIDMDALHRHCLRRVGKGAVLSLPAGTVDAHLGACVVEALARPEKLAPGLRGVRLPSAERDGVYVTRLSDGHLYYNSNAEARRVDGVEVPGLGIAWK